MVLLGISLEWYLHSSDEYLSNSMEMFRSKRYDDPSQPLLTNRDHAIRPTSRVRPRLALRAAHYLPNDYQSGPNDLAEYASQGRRWIKFRIRQSLLVQRHSPTPLGEAYPEKPPPKEKAKRSSKTINSLLEGPEVSVDDMQGSPQWSKIISHSFRCTRTICRSLHQSDCFGATNGHQ
jgi:hypothetical protein